MIQSVEQLAETVGVLHSLSGAGYRPGAVSTELGSPFWPAKTTRGAQRLTASAQPGGEGGRSEVLDSERFQDQAPREVYATLIDEGQYLCSVRTMYRILDEDEQVRERRNQLRHPTYVKPELLATQPNQLWSWDITKLLGPAKWTYYYLYDILDVFSRYVVGWLIAERESASLAEELIADHLRPPGHQPDQLTIHADRGSSMTSKPVALLMADLGVTKTHSRPHVSNDNPFSEAQFKTLKYRPDYPDRFGCQVDARVGPMNSSMVQLRTSPQRLGALDPGRCPFWPSPGCAPSASRC